MDPFFLLLGGLALILILQFSRFRRQQRAVRETQAGMEVGAEVLTAAGMVATVVAVGDATVTLRGPDGDVSRWIKAAVIRVVPDTDPVSTRYQPPAGTGTADTGVVDDDGTPRPQD